MGEGSYFNLFFYLKMFNDLPSPATPGAGEGPGVRENPREGVRGGFLPLTKSLSRT